MDALGGLEMLFHVIPVFNSTSLDAIELVGADCFWKLLE
jgi:hypothetical protein